MTRLATRTIAEEQMDAPDLDPAIYAAVMADLARVNRVTMAARPTLRFLGSLVPQNAPLRILDVGFGDGDMLRRIARWAVRHGRAVDLTGIDCNSRSVLAARAHTPDAMRIVFRAGDYRSLAKEPWDVVISSLVAHHMTHDELVAFLRFMESHARRGWFVNDLHRHALSHAGFPVLARLFRWHPMVRHDGTLSIARSYRPREWQPILAEAGITDAQVLRAFPFRLCVARPR